MKKFLELISEEMKKGFKQAGYEEELGRVTVSNRPDLCEYQCNGAMAGAKKYHKAPIMIANDVAAQLADSEVFAEVAAVAPGFLNLKLRDSFVFVHYPAGTYPGQTVDFKDNTHFNLPGSFTETMQHNLLRAHIRGNLTFCSHNL